MTKIAKATGHRGIWFAEVEGEMLPCVHQHWMHGGNYDDPYVSQGIPPWPEFLQAIERKRKVVLTKDIVTNAENGEEIKFERDGYVAVFAVDDVRVEGRHLLFRFTERLIELK